MTLETYSTYCNAGISIDKLFTMHFADDEVNFVKDQDDIRYMIRKLDQEYQTWVLRVG